MAWRSLWSARVPRLAALSPLFSRAERAPAMRGIGGDAPTVARGLLTTSKMIMLILALLLSQPIFQSSAAPTQQPSRPTQPTDPMPPPDMDYFIGAWSFEWNVPESPLGPAGKIKGTETYKKLPGNGSYESEIKGDGPEGALKGHATTSYNEKEKVVTRSETGLFGVSLTKTGPIGGDLGGYYTIFWETAPIKKDGKTIKLKGKTQMLSPAYYRLLIQISVDGGPYSNFGNPWFHKTEGKASG
jgi:hypothetical protein